MNLLSDQPLSPTQRRLRGKKIADLSVEQLRDWIDACDKMERWPRIEAKARRGWKESREKAEAELERRAAKPGKSGEHS